MRRVFSGLALLILLMGTLTLAFNIQPVRASGTIYIRADGNIDPSDAPISTFDNVTYTLIGNITSDADGIVVERSNIIIDGANYTVEGTGGGYGFSLYGITSVTIESTNIKSFGVGIRPEGSSGNSISENNVANNMVGIRLYSGSSNNNISGNHLTNNNYGIDLMFSDNNSIVGNVFAGCGILVSHSYGNRVEGNTVNGKPLVYLESVSDFTVKDAGQVILVNCNSIRVENLNLSNATQGVQLWRTSNTIIADNNIANNEYCGINLQFSSNNSTMSGNNITNNYIGIYIIFNIESSSNNSISGNNITANNEAGIYLSSSFNNNISGNNIANNWNGIVLYPFSDNNSVSGNNITNNENGIFLGASSNYNSISGNNITNNEYGIRLDYSSNNKICHNNFVNNTAQVYLYGSINAWDGGYPSGGNYWSDYNGTDFCKGQYQNETGGDGIGDASYTINENNDDRYPLMHPWSPLPVHNINTGLGYTTIKGAINAMETLRGHTIFVETGTYNESYIEITKALALFGEDRNTTIIDGKGMDGAVIAIKTSDVCINGFTIRNPAWGTAGIYAGMAFRCSVRNNLVSSNRGCGIELYRSDYNVLSDNIITSSNGIEFYSSSSNSINNNIIWSNGYGVYLESESMNNTFSGNIISDNTVYGVYFHSYSYGEKPCDNNTLVSNIVANNSGGIRFEYCTNNLIINNIISSNDEFGIILFHSNGSIVGNKLSNNGENSIVISSANGNNITRNIISNNKYGIDFYVSSDNVVKENTLLNNQYAIHIWINSNNNSVCENTISENSVGISLAYVGQTSVHHNNFINNTRHVEPQEASDSAWDDGYPSGGNYWSDYVCVDLHSGPYQNQTGSDGIGDTPYTIDVDNLDNYPLMMPWGSPQAIAASVDTYPETLNLWSKDSQVTSYIELPEGYDLININVSTIVLNGTVQEMFARTPFRPRPPPPGDHNNNSIPDLEVMFNHAELVNFMVSEDITFDNVTLSLTGQLYDGTRFQGSCLMRVSALTGDVNCDGKVSLQDLQLLAGAYNSHSGDPGWNGNANFAEPWDSIGLTDLVTVAIYYGQHSP